MKETGFIGFKERENMDQKLDDHLNFTKIVTLQLPFVGISLISSSPQVIYNYDVHIFFFLNLPFVFYPLLFGL
jgi:hypothetical protein